MRHCKLTLSIVMRLAAFGSIIRCVRSTAADEVLTWVPGGGTWYLSAGRNKLLGGYSREETL